ncbi:uncharacterized protein LOC110707921 isoform X3 [Chenopodium quinoa]|uniref:uncharacterized protein LOC110707921 isoform X3 n=1 Tax=Chenopodium quinoa TaxID=63459 RepID=UPI000B7916A4|nr:uncharacterized protein LOC110707921 isoform X3 [Chenopodium quinoa]
MPLLLSSTPTTASLFLKLTFPLAFLRFSTMSSINLQSHAFAGNPIKAKIPKSNDPFSPNSALEALKSHLLGNTHDAIALNFKVLPFRKGRPLAGSQGSSPNWHLGWLSLGDCKGLLADSSVKFEGDSLVYLGSKSEEDSVYWAIDVSEDDKLVDELGKKYFSFVELRTLMVATDWSDSRAMADLAVAGHPSSLPIKTDQIKKNTSEPQKFNSSSSASPCYSQENTVGIIGSVSVLTTLIFLEKFVLWSSRDKHETVPFIVCSDPTSPSSCEYISDNNGGSIPSGLDHVRMVENLRGKRLFLEEGGARCIVMPCHLSHAWYGEISQGSKQPFLHMAECVAWELKEAKFRPLEAGSGVKVGVIATDATLMAGFYQEKLQDQVHIYKFLVYHRINFILRQNLYVSAVDFLSSQIL